MCSLGIEPTTFCAADAMLYHWATQERRLGVLLPLTGTLASVIYGGPHSNVWDLYFFFSEIPYVHKYCIYLLKDTEQL